MNNLQSFCSFSSKIKGRWPSITTFKTVFRTLICTCPCYKSLSNSSSLILWLYSKFLFFVFLGTFCLYLDRTAEEQREWGMTCSKGSMAGFEPATSCRGLIASVYVAGALPTELNLRTLRLLFNCATELLTLNLDLFILKIVLLNSDWN